MNAGHLPGVGVALLAAAAWGSADFSGGVAARRIDQFQALGLAAVSGLGLLVICAWGGGESVPSGHALGWAFAAGTSGAIGLAGLYRGLSMRRAARFAPVVAVVGASAPVLAGVVSAGWPTATEVLGLITALGGIWLVGRAPSAPGQRWSDGIGLATMSGLGFGGFFIFVARIESDGVFGPLAVARVGTLVVATVVMLSRRLGMPRPTAHPAAILAGVLDAGGTVLYLIATRFTRLDVAAVLSSLYPAVTVLLASRLAEEDVTRAQWGGLAVCLAAVVLIAL